MFPEPVAWLIFFLPLASFLIIGLVLRPFFNDMPKRAGYLTIAAIAVSLGFSIWALAAVGNAPGHEIEYASHEWLRVGDLTISVGIMLNGLTAIMLVVVTLVSLMVQVYSQGYMAGDSGYQRYYASMALFTASMLGLVLADNLLMLYVFWEGVGLCSYLLIGHWYQRPAAAAAAKKAFIMTRFGDLGFLIAIIFIYRQAGTFDIAQIEGLAKAGTLSAFVITWLALGIFAGAVGKSAQFPLHPWLPDAMEGPTPVSALIHAATMVAAGVFLVARALPIFQESPAAMNVVAAIGGVTAIMAASMALVMNDIKRVMASSTISQLGYMMLSLGLGGLAAAIFHLFTHAMFKALLFLTAGSVNHATGTFDMRLMGGLRKAMPWTYLLILIASLSLAGIPPLSGFWSKDEVLATAWTHNRPLFWVGLATAFMTAFYIFRAVFMTFHGDYRGGVSAEPQAAHGASAGHAGPPHESPRVMLLPMAVLGLLAVVVGFANMPGVHWFSDLLGEEPEAFNYGVFVLALAAGVGGIALAYALYARGAVAVKLAPALQPAYRLLQRKYLFDDLYESVVVGRLLYRGVALLSAGFDRFVVDGLANTLGWTARTIGRLPQRLQTGQTQGYGLALFLGTFLIFLVWFLVRGI